MLHLPDSFSRSRGCIIFSSGKNDPYCLIAQYPYCPASSASTSGARRSDAAT